MRDARDRPTPAAIRVLGFLADPGEAACLAGDIEEEYADLRERRGRLPAAIWLWFQVVVSLPSFIKSYLYWRPAMFANYLRTAWRNLRKHKVFSFINIAGLAVGMACCILIFFWVDDELAFDRFHPNRDRLFRAVMRTEGTWITSSGWALAPTLKREFPEIRKATRVAFRNALVSFEDKSRNQRVVFVDPDFLEMFGFPLRDGDPRTAMAVNQSAVITETAARSIFGNADPMGKTLSVNTDQYRVPVTGVIADPPANSTLQFDVLIPLKIVGDAVDTDWSYESQCFVLLDENASPDVLRDFETWFDEAVPEGFRWTHTLEGPDDMPAHIRAALTATSITIPVIGGRPVLGLWQGIYVWEHRADPQQREVVVQLLTA